MTIQTRKEFDPYVNIDLQKARHCRYIVPLGRQASPPLACCAIGSKYILLFVMGERMLVRLGFFFRDIVIFFLAHQFYLLKSMTLMSQDERSKQWRCPGPEQTQTQDSISTK